MDDTTGLRLAAELRRLRADRPMTQEDLAAASGVSVQTIRRAEKNASVGADSLRAICAALDVDLVALSQEAERALAPRAPVQVPTLDDAPDPIHDLKFAVATILYPVVTLPFMATIIAFAQGPFVDAGIIYVAPLLDLVFVTFVLISGLRILRACTPPEVDSDRSIPLRQLGVMGEIVLLSDLMIGGTIYLMTHKQAYTAAAILMTAGWVFGLLGIGGFTYGIQKRARARFRAAMQAREETCAHKMPSILVRLNTLVSRPVDAPALTEIEQLVQEACDLSVQARRAIDAKPLQLLVEDVRQGISSPARLADYITVAQRIFTQPIQRDHTDHVRPPKDVIRDVERLEGRFSLVG